MRSTKLITTTLGAFALAACGDSTTPGSGVALSFSTFSPSAAPSPPAGMFAVAFDDTLTAGSDTLIITKAEIVLREIELKRVTVIDCDTADDACEEFAVGPLLLDLPLNGQTAVLITIDIPADTYDEIEFEIHKVSNDNPGDAEFRAAHPDLLDTSIRVQGTFNGQSFTYVTDLNVDQEFDLVPPLVIDEMTGTTNVTVRIDSFEAFEDEDRDGDNSP